MKERIQDVRPGLHHSAGWNSMLILTYYCRHCGWSDKVLIPECEINKPKWVRCQVCSGKALLVFPEKKDKEVRK